ncbi:MAG: hypothetical protein LCH53_13695 [Bacteroidetes bacterium]|nr:hypothetical protein [Bacteroidota bacterium]
MIRYLLTVNPVSGSTIRLMEARTQAPKQLRLRIEQSGGRVLVYDRADGSLIDNAIGPVDIRLNPKGERTLTLTLVLLDTEIEMLDRAERAERFPDLEAHTVYYEGLSVQAEGLKDEGRPGLPENLQ